MLPVRHAFMNKSVSSSAKQQEALASTKETEGELDWSEAKLNKRAIRAASSYKDVPATFCKTTK